MSYCYSLSLRTLPATFADPWPCVSHVLLVISGKTLNTKAANLKSPTTIIHLLFATLHSRDLSHVYSSKCLLITHWRQARPRPTKPILTVQYLSSVYQRTPSSCIMINTYVRPTTESNWSVTDLTKEGQERYSELNLKPFCPPLQPTTKLFIDGKFVESQTSEWIDIHNPVSSMLSTTTTTTH